MNFLNELPLVEISHQHQLHKDVITDFTALQNAANIDGISLDIASSYRSIERQLLIWNNKWQGKRPLYDRAGNLLDAAKLTDKEKLDAILTWSALPGASRHHWGTDIDVYDAPSVRASSKPLELVVAEYESSGPCYTLAQWMTENLAAYGFYRPYLKDTGGVALEPWHISHIAISQHIQQLMTVDGLEVLIRSLNIEGKATILTDLNWIYENFVMNIQSV